MIVTKLCVAGIAIILEICIASTTTPNYVNETNHASTFSHLESKRRNFTRHALYRSMDGDAALGSARHAFYRSMDGDAAPGSARHAFYRSMDGDAAPGTARHAFYRSMDGDAAPGSARHAFYRSMDGDAAPGTARHAFYRSMDGDAAPGSGGSRRVFGGASAQLSEFPAVCALLDRYWSVRCSATVLAERWALTAAHCITPRIAYVKYNTRRPASTDGNVTAVHFLYRHPGYVVEQKDEGRGMDVTRLHHDVGLVRTRDVMKLTSSPAATLDTLRLFDPESLYDEEVQVLGFGRTERSLLGEELFAVRLRLVRCGHAAWLHCVCGSADEPRGVCSGDSGGPVLYRGQLIGVTSMGPAECARGSVPAGATSVFTALPRYADVVEATVRDAERALRMRIIARAHSARPCAALAAALCAAACALHGDRIHNA